MRNPLPVTRINQPIFFSGTVTMPQLMVRIFKSLQEGPGFLVLIMLVSVAVFVGYEVLHALVG
ncbi:hypothetical protein [Gluconobacter kanchanaburiensis]|uniref:hypothetical protein n=1 Tax=Gluconobacter kanchanaburiensis TaxID=563199 RepID=UPI0011BDC412|nr:hypothetical protein [Gluconobacter kanchanaburiensis]MBF0860551.1 hypothetical protein [Gluconobacter kanchanaburiensis]GBR69343.1 hypothetical protein AA103587_1272 [Gluconobacter kanchanaburiensis NBRC 103587]